ncbi:MAG: hypothetical protein QM779_02720 [Propionicimonas sp.]|uniref:hypothetical protein n=1 Tax=Propionicimonas sp. TaxID=1955623 RepID=UPI003D148507
MTVHEDLATQYHQQDTDYYCGAASAQMVLEQCGAGLVDQVTLYADNHAHSTAESGWYTAPDGLTWTMNNHQSSKYFVLDARDDEDSISRIIAWTIHHYRISPIAMVYGWAHWIVVRGVTTSATPTSFLDPGYTISGFDVNNPWPPTPAPPGPPPHTAGDVCGSGGNRGVADEHISYATWQADYMTGIPSGHWAGKFVAVCDPEPPGRAVGFEREPFRPRFDGAELLDAEVAGRLSLELVEEAGLTERARWRKAFGAEVVGRPELVQRLDRPDSFYYLVPRGGDGIATSVVALDARFGTYQQSRIVTRRRQPALLTLGRDAIEEFVFGRVHQLPGRQGELRIRPDIACVSRNWVWRPCRESLSPYYPFTLVSYGPHRLYLRSDGRMFSRLTAGARGI